MLVIPNAVSDHILSLCNAEIDQYVKKQIWTFSTANWHPYLYDGYHSTCLAAPPSNIVAAKARTAVTNHLPKIHKDKIRMNYHYWLKNSGVNWHGDEDYIFGATLYLNEWKKEWGGLYLWIDKNSGDMHGLCPKPGTLVINNEAEEHSVTQVSSTAKYSRRAIQFWGMKNEV